MVAELCRGCIRIANGLSGSLLLAAVFAQDEQVDSVVCIKKDIRDHVCLGCGTVLEERCIDMGCEWRSFKLEGVHSGMNVESRQRAELFVDEVDEALFEESAPNSLGTL
eukprot:11189-Amphidinium_carterae.1